MVKPTFNAVLTSLTFACIGLTSATIAAQPAAPVVLSEPTGGSTSPVRDISGDWGGTLMGALRLVLHVSKSPSGDYTAVFESIDQGHAMIPVDKVDVTTDHMTLSVAAVHGSFDAQWDAKGMAWTGTWSQGRKMPLTLTRVNGSVPKPKRPQEEAIEAGALPYSRQSVNFDDAGANVRLAGSFSVPRGTGKFPAVVLISGSGPNTRDEDVLGHKVFLVLSDYLARRGIAVLCYDKRGIGESTGDYKSATTADFAADANAAVAYLRSRPDVDDHHIGLIGHSEGGLIAPMVAAQDPNIGFIVLLAAPAISGDKLLAEQLYLIAKADGAPDPQGSISRKVHQDMFTAIANAANDSDARTAAESVFDKAVEQHQISAESDRTKVNLTNLTTPWMRYFFHYDPVPTLQQLRLPVLAMNGSLDLQVPSQENQASLKVALRNDKDVTVIELPGLNHLFQSTTTGAPADYGLIEETINPAALNRIGEWVAAHAK